MKIVLIGSGNLPIPPVGWGAVEIVIWDISIALKEKSEDVHIINTTDQDEIVRLANNIQPDIVHLHCDKYYKCLDLIDCKIKIITSHDPNLDIKNINVKDNIFITVLSQEIKEKYIKAGVDAKKIFLTPNGASEKNFRYSNTCLYPNKSIYLAVIEERKKQYKYQSINSIDFVGHVYNNFLNRFDITNPRFLNWWPKEVIYTNLTNYANLVLLSEAEAHSLSISEALLAGLGVVISEACCANLDLSKPWITVIPNDKLDDINYVEQSIIKNREISIKHKDEIRQHSLETLSWKIRIDNLYKLYKQLYNI